LGPAIMVGAPAPQVVCTVIRTNVALEFSQITKVRCQREGWRRQCDSTVLKSRKRAVFLSVRARKTGPGAGSAYCYDGCVRGEICFAWSVWQPAKKKGLGSRRGPVGCNSTRRRRRLAREPHPKRGSRKQLLPVRARCGRAYGRRRREWTTR
jgi:hypothetical protein